MRTTNEVPSNEGLNLFEMLQNRKEDFMRMQELVCRLCRHDIEKKPGPRQ